MGTWPHDLFIFLMASEYHIQLGDAILLSTNDIIASSVMKGIVQQCDIIKYVSYNIIFNQPRRVYPEE